MGVESAPPPPCWKVVLTGGPCAGKSTALARASAALRDSGYRVFTVPEAASIMFLNGASVEDLGHAGFRFAMQRNIIELQACLEDGMERMARECSQPAIILCDRGQMDGAAYMEAGEWTELLRTCNLDMAMCREGRYDAVIHLVTAAAGAEEFYTLENNAARSESPEAAKEQDSRTLAVWMGHPRLYVFDNSTGFDEKMNRVISVLSRLVGLPSRGGERRQRVLLREPPVPEELELPWQGFAIQKIFLAPGEPPAALAGSSNNLRPNAIHWYRYVTKRTSEMDNCVSYSVTTRVHWSDGRHSEHARVIAEREFKTLSELADPARVPVLQRRVCFTWEHKSYALTTYKCPHQGLSFLDTHVLPEESQVAMGSVPRFWKKLAVQGIRASDGEKHSAFKLSLRS